MNFLTAIVNPAGLLVDPYLAGEIRSCMAGVEDVYFFAHGWQTDFARGAMDYNRFGAELAPYVPPNRKSLCLAMHWPSVLAQDPWNPVNLLNPFAFYSMEHLADTVGAHAGDAILATAIACATGPVRIIGIGHSFGCRVVARALSQMQAFSSVTYRAVLLQAAFENDMLQADRDYGNMVRLPTCRAFVTTSKQDSALGTAFPAAESVNWFADGARVALGYDGPTELTRVAWGDRLTVCPIDAIQLSDNLPGFNVAGGRHTDIYGHPRLYSAIGDFLKV